MKPDDCHPKGRTTLHSEKQLKRPALFALMVIISCAEAPRPITAEAAVDVVAKVGADSLTVKDVEARLAEQPDFVRARYQTLERKREFVDTLVREQLLVAEAHRQKLQNDREVKATVEKVLVQKLLQKELVVPSPSEVELQAWYDAHRDEFVRPERIRVSHVLWPSSAATKSSARKERERLTKLKSELQSAAFAELAQRESKDEPSRSSGGDLGPRTRDELTALWGATVTEAAFTLIAPGEVAPIVEGAKGLHLLRLIGRQVAQTQTFEEARAGIANRLAGEARATQLEALVARLRKASSVEIDEKNLAKVAVKAPSGPLVP